MHLVDDYSSSSSRLIGHAPSSTGRKLFCSSAVFNIRQDDRSNEGLTLETLAFKLFTVANLRYQLSC